MVNQDWMIGIKSATIPCHAFVYTYGYAAFRCTPHGLGDLFGDLQRVLLSKDNASSPRPKSASSFVDLSGFWV